MTADQEFERASQPLPSDWYCKEKRLTKGEAVAIAMNTNEVAYDIVLPQGWLNEFANKVNLSYQQCMFGSIWAYPVGNLAGVPMPVTRDVARALYYTGYPVLINNRIFQQVKP